MDDLVLGIDGLGKLVDSVARKTADLLKKELPLQRLITDPTPAPAKIYGINPYQLYTTSEVAERFHMSPSGVRRLPEEDLPRAPWQGAEIRYRGIDILRYEGVAVENLLSEAATSASGRQTLEHSESNLNARERASAFQGRSKDRSREARSPAPGGASSPSSSIPSNPSDPEGESSPQDGSRNNHPNLPEL